MAMDLLFRDRLLFDGYQLRKFLFLATLYLHYCIPSVRGGDRSHSTITMPLGRVSVDSLSFKVLIGYLGINWIR